MHVSLVKVTGVLYWHIGGDLETCDVYPPADECLKYSPLEVFLLEPKGRPAVDPGCISIWNMLCFVGDSMSLELEKGD